MTRETKLEKRLNPRAKVSRMLRVRPSDSSAEHFQELPVTVNVSKAGLYFHTHLSAYRVGMRLFVTYPFTFANDPMQSEYLAEVVRVEQLTDKRFGIAVRANNEGVIRRAFSLVASPVRSSDLGSAQNSS